MNIAIHNLHKLPHLTNICIHNYAVELVKKGFIKYLYFDTPGFKKRDVLTLAKLLQEIRSQYKWHDLGLDKAEIIFSPKKLYNNCDVLLNFNSTRAEEFTPVVKKFNGIKIFHLMDYFWIEPGSKKNQRLKDYGVNYVFSYGRPDKYCPYFQKYFPDYLGKVIPLAFGFAPRFVNKVPFSQRKKKYVALGSVNPFRPPDAEPINYIETANFYNKEKWLHKFRRMLVENRDKLSEVMDSMLPVFPKYKDFKYDLVKKFNEYQMFISDETMFYFPTAKTYEGPASGTVMVCSDHPCFNDFGFIDGVNCIKHRQFDISDFKEKVSYYIKNQDKLEKIQKTGTAFVRKKYSHAAIADKLYSIITEIYYQKQNFPEKNIDLRNQDFWKKENPPQLVIKETSISPKFNFKNGLIVVSALIGINSFKLLRYLKNIANRLKNWPKFFLTNLLIDFRQLKTRILHKSGSYLSALTKEAERICLEIKNDTVLGDYFLDNNPWIGRPWQDFNYWNGWYALSKIKKPEKILEIGTAFGFSTISLARGAGKNLKLLISLDLGNFGKLFTDSFPAMDNLLYVQEGIDQFKKENHLNFNYLQFAVNTQSPPYTDNQGNPVECPYWQDNKGLINLLEKTRFDLILIDGKHTDDGLYNDLVSFFNYGRKGCLIVCDDLQHKDAIRSFSRFVKERKNDISEYYIWKYLTCNAEYDGTFRRDQGLIIKNKYVNNI